MGVLENICSPLKSFPHSEKLERVAWLIWSEGCSVILANSKFHCHYPSYYNSEVPVGLVFRGPSMLSELPFLSLCPLTRKCSRFIEGLEVEPGSCFGTRNGFPGRQFFHELGRGYGGRFGMIQAYYIYCALYF